MIAVLEPDPKTDSGTRFKERFRNLFQEPVSVLISSTGFRKRSQEIIPVTDSSFRFPLSRSKKRFRLANP